MDKFELISEFRPTGDQPQAIDKLCRGIEEGKKVQVLQGATGTGKTFTMANIIARENRPTLVFSHNKTLAGQLYSEFKELFPHNRVEFFVSNFDYYQPEAYMPKNDMYIEKTAAINEELDMFRESTLNSLLERRDTIVVASVACIYAASDPVEYKNMFMTIRVGETYDRNTLLKKLVELQYTRNDMEQSRGTIRVRGDVLDLTPSYTDQYNIRIEMSSHEPPVADGSAQIFSELLDEAGLVEQEAERKVYAVDKAFAVYDGDRYIAILPYDGYRISFTSINNHPMLGTQYFDVLLDKESFRKEIKRTF